MENMTNRNSKCNSNCVDDNNVNPVDSEQKKVAIRNALRILNTSQNIQNNWNKFIKSPHTVAQRRTYIKVIAPGEESNATFSRCNSDSMFSKEYDFSSTVYDLSNEENNSNPSNCNIIVCKEQSAKSNNNGVSTNVCAREAESINDKSKSEIENNALVKSEASVTDMPYKRYKAKRPEWLRIRHKAQRCAQAILENNNHKNSHNVNAQNDYSRNVNEENTNYENSKNYRRNKRNDDGTFDNITNHNVASAISTLNGARSDEEQIVLTQKSGRYSNRDYDGKLQNSTIVMPTEHQHRVAASKEMTQFNSTNYNHNKCSVNNANVVKQRQQRVACIPDNHAKEINDSVINTHPYEPTSVKWKNKVDYAGKIGKDRTHQLSNSYRNKSNDDSKETKKRWKTNYPETQYLPSGLTPELQPSHLSSSFSHLSTSSESESSSTASTAHRYSAPVITHRFTDYDAIRQKYPFVINSENYNNVSNYTQPVELQIRLSAPQEHSLAKHHTEHKWQEQSEEESVNSRKEQESPQLEHEFVSQRHIQPFRSHMNNIHVLYAQNEEELKQNIPFVEYNHQPRAKLYTDRRSRNELETVIHLNDSSRNHIASHKNNNYSTTSFHNLYSPLQLHVSSSLSSSSLMEHSLTTKELQGEKYAKSKCSTSCKTSRPPREHSRSAAWFAAISQNIGGCDDKSIHLVNSNEENKHETEINSVAVDQHHSSNDDDNNDNKRENTKSTVDSPDASFVYSAITNNNDITDSNGIISNKNNSKSQEFERKNSNSMSLFVHTMPSLMQQQEQEESLSCQQNQRLNSSVFNECSLLNLSNTLPSLLQCYDSEQNTSFFDNANRYEYDTISMLNYIDANKEDDKENAAISDNKSII